MGWGFLTVQSSYGLMDRRTVNDFSERHRCDCPELRMLCYDLLGTFTQLATIGEFTRCIGKHSSKCASRFFKYSTGSLVFFGASTIHYAMHILGLHLFS